MSANKNVSCYPATNVLQNLGLCNTSYHSRKGNDHAGEDAKLVLRLIRLMVLEQGRFTLRDGHLTLGTGVITKVLSALSETERLALTEGKKAREKKADKA